MTHRPRAPGRRWDHKKFQIDAGVYIGLNKATPRYVAYTGFAYRF